MYRTTGWRWRRRLGEVGRIEELGEHSRRLHASPNQTSEEVQRRIVALRGQYGWGALKLQTLLAREGRIVSVAKINRVLARRGAIRPQDSHRPAAQRFERNEPNQLWQMDFKGIGDRLAERHGAVYPLSILDDHSRFLVGFAALREPSTALTMKCLREIFEPYGLPEAMLMDHGVPWWSTSNGHGLTQLTVWLMKQGIRLYFSGVGHPQTQGKVERLHPDTYLRFNHTSRCSTTRLKAKMESLSPFLELFHSPVGSRTGAVRLGVRLQPPPHQTQRADFPHCAFLPASRQGLWTYRAGSAFESDSVGTLGSH